MSTTWVDGAAGSAYDIDNLPYGVFARADEEPRVGVRIGDLVLTRSWPSAARPGPRPGPGWSTSSPTRPTGQPSSRTCTPWTR